MIHLTDQDVAEFQAIHLKETGREITEEEAREYATSLIQLVAIAMGVDEQLNA